MAKARQGPASQAAETAVQTLIRVAVPLWLLSAVIVGLASGSGWPQPLLLGCATLVGLAYANFWIRRRTLGLVLTLLGTGVALAWASPPSYDLSGGAVVSTWASLASLSVGALVPGTWAIPGAAAAGFGLLGLAHVHQAVLGSQGMAARWFEVAVFAVFAGVLAAAVVGVLRRTAGQADDLASARALAEAAARREEGGQAEARRITRMLHDTVVNTLCAVHQWRQRDPDAVRARAAADLQLLRSVDQRAVRDPQILLDSASLRARLLGLDLDIVPGNLGPQLDEPTAIALQGACWESLNNIAKHAGVTRAQLSWSWDGQQGQMTIADAGVGFAPERGWTGGSRASVLARCAEAGVVPVVHSVVGAGTTVELGWWTSGQQAASPAALSAAAPVARTGQAVPAERGELDRPMAETVLRMCGVVAVTGLASIVMLPPGLPQWGNVATLGIIAVVAALGRRMSQGAAPPRLPLLVYPVATAAVAVLPAFGRAGTPWGGLWWWGPPASIVVATASFLLDRRRGTVALAALGSGAGILLGVALIGPAPGYAAPDRISLLIVDLGAIAALAAYRGKLSQAWAAGRREQELLQAEQAAAARAAEEERIRAQLLGLARQAAEPVLRDIAEGGVDPRDRAVRDRCGRAEATVRALSAVGAHPSSPVGQALTALVLKADERDVELRIAMGPQTSLPPASAAPEVRSCLEALVAVCPAGSSAQVTVLQLGPTLRLLAVAQVADPRDIQTLTEILASTPSRRWTLTVTEGQVLCEATWEQPEEVAAREKQPALLPGR